MPGNTQPRTIKTHHCVHHTEVYLTHLFDMHSPTAVKHHMCVNPQLKVVPNWVWVMFSKNYSRMEIETTIYLWQWFISSVGTGLFRDRTITGKICQP